MRPVPWKEMIRALFGAWGGPAHKSPKSSRRRQRRRSAGRPVPAWLCEPLEDRIVLSALTVSPATDQGPIDSQSVTAGQAFSFNVQLDVDDGQAAASEEVTLRLHFDASVLDFVSITDVFAEGGATVVPGDLTALEPQADTGDLDGDAATTRFVELTFTFPDGAPDDAQLFAVTFNSIDDESETTHVNFSGDVGAEDTFAGSPLTVEVTGQATDPLEPVITGPAGAVSLAPFTVTIDFGATVTGFEANDVTVTGGTASDVTPVSGADGKYTVKITPSVEGPLTVALAAGAVQYDGGAANLAADPFAVTVNGQDFGDAPDSYGTSLDEDGARHNADGPTLGVERDVEADATPPLDGTGDDVDAESLVTVTQADEEIITLHTNFGSIRLRMIRDGDNPPDGTVENFLNYVREGSYLGSFFHRYVAGFVLQGGGFTTSSDEFTSVDQFTTIPTDDPIENEFDPDRSNVIGTVAMAKVGGDPDSATSQFFFNLGNNAGNLDSQNGGFTVFAEVLDMTVLTSILEDLVPTDADGGTFSDLPVTDDSQLLVIQSVGVGTVAGVAYTDANGNGVRDTGEAGLAGAVIYVDANNNGTRDAGELSATSDTDGSYEIGGVPLGQAVIRYEAPDSRTATGPFAQSGHVLTMDVGDQFANVNFGSVSTDSAPSLVPATDDEDGVTISGDFQVTIGQSDSAVVNIQNTDENARLFAWIDFNRDGDFDDQGEQVADGTGEFAGLGDGEVTVPFTVPASATAGTTYARFRVSTQADLGPTGLAADGEVEDYRVQFVTPPPPPPVLVPGDLNNRDFDGDGKADRAMFNPETGRWMISLSNGGTMSWDDFTHGAAVEASGDFDGDGRANDAVFVPEAGLWRIEMRTDSNGDGVADGTVKAFWPRFDTSAGWTHHVTGDFNGDRIPDIANFNPQLGAWWISIAADADGDGTPDTFITTLQASLDTAADWTEQITADFNGDGFLDIANYHAGTDRWWISVATDVDGDSRPDAFVTRQWTPPADNADRPQPAAFTGTKGTPNPTATPQLTAPTPTTLEEVLEWLDGMA